METEPEKPVSIEDSVFEERMIVLMEDIEAGVFHQVSLDEEQYKEIGKIIAVSITKEPNLKPDFEIVHLHFEDDKTWPISLFDGVEPIHPDHKKECEDEEDEIETN